jgi:predicted transcriptional regulator
MKTEKTMKSVKLDNALIKKIEAKAKKEKRTPHYLMVEALEKSFK